MTTKPVTGKELVPGQLYRDIPGSGYAVLRFLFNDGILHFQYVEGYAGYNAFNPNDIPFPESTISPWYPVEN